MNQETTDTIDGLKHTEEIQNSVFYVLFISSIAAIGGFLFGFDSGVINGTVSALSSSFGSDSVATGMNVASVLLGCAVGALVAGPMADKVGRRPIMIATAVIFAISALGSGIANSAGEFVFYRILGGLGVGAASVLAPAYIAEVAPSSLRGRLATLQQLAIVIGIFVAFFSNYTLASLSGGAEQILWFNAATWRWMFWAEIIPSILFLVGVLFIPESPRYLVAKGNIEGARAVFRRISSGAENTQIEEVQKSLHGDHRPRLTDLFIAGSKKIHPIIWVGIVLSLFQQFVGINVVFYYGAELWKAGGFDESQSLFINVITGTTNITATFIAIALIDKIGRKPLLLIGSIGMFVTLGLLAIIFGTADVNESGTLALGDTAGFAALIGANLYVAFFGMSWGPVVWVLLGEMFNNRIRGAALAVAASAQWLANFIVSLSFPSLLEHIGLGGAYGIYTFFALISIFFVVKFIEETRGKRLEQM